MTEISVVFLLLAACMQLCQHGVRAEHVSLTEVPACPPPATAPAQVHCVPLKSRKKCKLVIWPGRRPEPGVPHISSANLDSDLRANQTTAHGSRSGLVNFLHVHLPWIAQATMDKHLHDKSNPCWLVSDHYINLYSLDWRIPLFTAHRLTQQNVAGIDSAPFTRTRHYKSGFRTDLRLSSAQSSQCNYFGGVVKGHMVPAEDMKYDVRGYINSFVLSNVAPTTEAFEGSWTPIEKRVNKAVIEKKTTVYAISGPIITDPDNPRWIASGGIVNPAEYFKVILWCRGYDYPTTCQLEGECYTVNRTGFVSLKSEDNCPAATLESIKLATKLKIAENDAGFLSHIWTSIQGRLTGWFHYGKRQALLEYALSDAVCNYMNNTIRSLSDDGRVVMSLGDPSIPDQSLLSKPAGFWVIDIPTSDEAELASPGTVISAKVLSGETVNVDEILPITHGVNLIPNTLELDNITYDCSNSKMDVHIKVGDDLTIIPNILVLQNATISFTAILGLTEENATIPCLVFSGVWSLGSYTAQFAIKYSSKWQKLYFKASSGHPVTLDIPHFIEDLTGVSLSLPYGSVTFDDIHVLGIMDTFVGGTATIGLSGEFTNGAIHIISQFTLGTSNLQHKVAFAAEIYNINFADIVQKLTGTDISSVPFFGSLVIPEIGITTATGYINSYILSNLYKSGSLLEKNGVEIDQGFSAYFSLNFPSVGLVALEMSLSDDEFVFEVYGSLTLKAMLSQIPVVNVDTLPLPSGISDILELQVSRFFFSHQLKALEVELFFPDTLSYFNGVLVIDQPSVIIYADFNSPTTVTLDLDGEIEIGGNDYGVAISRDPSINKYVVSVHIDHLPLSSLTEELGAQVLPEDLSALILGTGFLEFSIKELDIRYPLASQPQQIYTSGIPVISGLTAPRLSCVVIRQPSNTFMVEGFEIGSVNLADFIKQLTGMDLRSIAILTQNVDVALLISPATLPNVQLVGDQLEGLSITRGISLQAGMSWPDDCSSDSFCNVAQTLLGADARFTLQATYESAMSFSLFAGLNDLQLGSGLTLSNAGLLISVGTETEVGIQGSMVLTNPPITFTGGIFVGIRGVVLEMSMTGCWDKAFGVPWISACSLYISTALKPIPAPLIGLALGGQIKLGDPSCNNRIIATGFLGIDPMVPQENFFYTNIESALTFRSLLNAFCLNPSLPQPLADSGFPKGFLTSFSMFGKELPHVPLSIPQGFRFNGTFNILGLSASADIRIGLPTGIYSSLSLPVLNLGDGLLSMYASSSDRSRGPHMNADLTLLPTPNAVIAARGYVSVLGIEAEAALMVTNTLYELNIQGRMLNVFEASLTIYASYGSISTATFRVQGSFRNDLFSSLNNKVTSALQNAADEASAAISSAQDEVNRKKKDLDDAITELTRAQQKVNSANSAFDSAVAEIQNWQNQINSICTIQTCGSVCIGCSDGWACCGEVWGSCVCWHPTWNGCCYEQTDPLCLAANAGCYALKAPLQASLELAETVVDQSRIVLDAAIAVLEVAKHTVTVAQGAFDVAVAALEAAEQTYHVGLEAGNVIASFGLGGAINIEKLEFDVLLSAASGGAFSGSLTASFAGQASTTISVHVNLYDITAMAKELANHVVSGLSSLF